MTTPSDDREAALARIRAGRNELWSGYHVKQPELVPLPESAGKCRAETFDGVEPKRCTRPASFLRDGLAVCVQHSRLEHVQAAPL